MPSQPKVPVTILLAESARVDAVVAALQAAGLSNARVQAALGTVTGEAPADAIARLRAVPSVQAVEQGGTFQLPPEDRPQ